MKPDLRLDGISIRRKRVLLHNDSMALGNRPVERNHHQMQIHRQRVHGDDFQRLSAHQPCGLVRQQLVVLHPWMPRVEMAADTQQFPVFQLLLDISAYAPGLQSERLSAEIDALTATGRSRDMEPLAMTQSHPRPTNGMLVAMTVIN